MRLIILLVALFGGFVLVAMFVAPHQPTLRDWYIQNACPYLDQMSTDICAAARRGAGGRAAANPQSRESSAYLLLLRQSAPRLHCSADGW
jgi:hypothetical protein